MSIKLVGGLMDTRSNNEDFALTPYLFLVYANGAIFKIYGIGICWGYYAAYLGIGFGLPKGIGRFRIYSKNK